MNNDHSKASPIHFTCSFSSIDQIYLHICLDVMSIMTREKDDILIKEKEGSGISNLYL